MPFLDHILWNKKVFNGQWSDASKSYDVIDKASSIYSDKLAAQMQILYLLHQSSRRISKLLGGKKRI